jgi:hypothetical protein
MRSIVTILAALVLALVCGCGKDEKKKEAVALDQIPENVMKAAKDKLPDVKFDRAVRKANGEYEILGKDKQGKVREIDLTPSGEVTEIDK